MKSVFFLTVCCLSILLLPSVSLSVPPGKSITFPGGSAGEVIFNGKSHADAGKRCGDCHTKIFNMKKGSAKIDMSKHNSDDYCAKCHSYDMRTSGSNNCMKCHKSYKGGGSQSVSSSSYGEDAASYSKQGLDYAKKGEYQKAIELFNKSFDLYDRGGLVPKLSILHYNRGLTYYNIGDYDRAIADYSKAIELNDKSYIEREAEVMQSAYQGLGLAYHQKREYDSAIKNYKKAIELDASDAESKKLLENLQKRITEGKIKKYCPVCGKEYEYDENYCGVDGTKLLFKDKN